ncbi:hypothetical protein UNSW1_1765 [Campylobacter concisus UNSW1]|uniref:Uncharacterized protein n=1 Tax=Campylobacter concisus TaxID=199 RepID=A0A2R4P0F9_9BACT|nr:hypothetical protein CCS77_1111 [Campylobacter concisus]EIF06189.1 hypothetical protein UNSWCD_1441 [Campylobacter concisus UNSWCD]ERJ21127.1 hypothetical protein UNSW1_1765 [Campylobacter concisus UNSW1]
MKFEILGKFYFRLFCFLIKCKQNQRFWTKNEQNHKGNL